MKLFLSLVTGATALSQGTNERPIAKIIKLLKDMTAQMEAEREDDNAVHKKYQCWCDKEKEEKSNIVKAQKAEMKKQDSAKKGAFSESQKKHAKRDEMRDNKNKKQESLESLRTKCNKENGEFSNEDQELEKSIIATRNAITILKKHNFLQGESKVTNTIKRALEQVADSEGVQLRAMTDSSGLVALESFINADEPTSFLQQSPGFASYANQSGQIFGILEQMLQDLTRDQSDGAKAEKARQEACNGGDAALQKEISLLSNTLSRLDARLGELAQTQADAQEDFDAAEVAHGNAVQFLGNLDNSCTKNQADYDSRTKSREEELAAIRDTIDILDNDKAFASLGRAFGTAEAQPAAANFLQLRKQGFKASRRNDVINSELRRSAIQVLDKYSKKDAKTFLVQYLIKSAAVDQSAIKKVQEKIDLLIKEMKVQQSEEIISRDECIEDFNKLKLNLDETQRDKGNTEEEHSAHEEELASLTKEIEDLKAANKKMKQEAAEATEDRQKDTAEFQVLVRDHQEVQAILAKALERMKQVYKSFVQEPEQIGADFTNVESTDTHAGSGPAAFTNEGKTEQNKGGNKVLNLLSEVLQDSQQTEKDATVAEQDAQNAYESFMNQTQRDMEANDKAIAQKTTRSGQTEGLLADAEAQIKSLSQQIFDLTEENGAIHKRCDFVMNNFDARQAARQNEMEALRQAKQLLGGMAA